LYSYVLFLLVESYYAENKKAIVDLIDKTSKKKERKQLKEKGG